MVARPSNGSDRSGKLGPTPIPNRREEGGRNSEKSAGSVNDESVSSTNNAQISERSNLDWGLLGVGEVIALLGSCSGEAISLGSSSEIVQIY